MSSSFSKSVSEAPSLRWLTHWQHRATATCATVANHRSAQLGAYISSTSVQPIFNGFARCFGHCHRPSLRLQLRGHHTSARCGSCIVYNCFPDYIDLTGHSAIRLKVPGRVRWAVVGGSIHRQWCVYIELQRRVGMLFGSRKNSCRSTWRRAGLAR